MRDRVMMCAKYSTGGCAAKIRRPAQCLLRNRVSNRAGTKSSAPSTRIFVMTPTAAGISLRCAVNAQPAWRNAIGASSKFWTPTQDFVIGARNSRYCW